MGGDVRISQSALTQELFLAASLGMCQGAGVNVKFGYGPDIANGAFATVWAGTKTSIGQLVYVFPNKAGETVEAVSDVAGDTTQSMQIQGLDANGNPQAETIALNGTTPVPSVNTWLSVDRAFIVGAVPVVGEVVVQGDGSTSVNIFVVVLPADQQTVQVATIIPAEKVAVVVNYSTALNKAGSQDASAVMRLAAKRPGGVARTAIRYGIQRDGVGNLSSDLIIPAVFPPLTEVYVTAEVATVAGTADISAEFSYLLLDASLFSAEYLAAL